MLIGFVQGYAELKWGISKLNPLCNGPLRNVNTDLCDPIFSSENINQNPIFSLIFFNQDPQLSNFAI